MNLLKDALFKSLTITHLNLTKLGTFLNKKHLTVVQLNLWVLKLLFIFLNLLYLKTVN